MPGLMTDYAAGARAYATPEIIQAELEQQRATAAAQQANAARTNQTTQIEGYQLRDLQALSALSQGQPSIPPAQLSSNVGGQPSQMQMPTLQSPSFQNITGIAGLGDTASTDDYLQFQREQQQFTELQSRLQNTQQKYDAVVDPERKKFFREEMNSIQKEMISSQENQNKKQGEMTKKLYSPIVIANDDLTWNMGKAQLAKEAANAAVAKAIQEKIPEENLEKVRSDAYKSAFDSLPSSYNNTARNIQANVQQQLEGSEGRQKEMKADSEYQKVELDMQKTDLEMKKLKAETNKLQAEFRDGKKEKEKDLTTEHGKWVTQSNTAFDNLGKSISRVTELEEQIKFHKDKTEGWFTNPTAEEEIEATRLAAELVTARANKDRLQKDIDYAEHQKQITEEMIKAKGLPVPKPEPKPKSKVNPANFQVSAEAASQGYTIDQVLQEIARVNPGHTNEQLIQKAIENGFISKVERKVVAKPVEKVISLSTGQRAAAARREQIKDKLAEVTFGKLYSALSSIEQTRIDREVKLKAQRSLY